MFKIKWRNRQRSFIVREGLSRYADRAAAEAQVAKWQEIFSANTYYIEPA
jgi:hypothetical protein